MLAPSEGPPERPLWQRLAWMGALWAMSVAALGTIAWLIRWWLGLG